MYFFESIWFEFLIIAFPVVYFITIPVSYIIYLNKRIIPEEFAAYYFEGKFNAENVNTQISLLEKEFGLSFNRVKKQILRYEYVSHRNLDKYADKVKRQLFCIMMNGRERFEVFKKFADPMLKFITISLMFIMVIYLIILTCVFGETAFFVSIMLAPIIYTLLLKQLSLFMDILRFIRRLNGKKVGGMSLAIFAIDSVFRRNVEKRFNPKTGRYHYYENITYISPDGSNDGDNDSLI